MSDAEEAPIGQRFTHVYMERKAPASDSARMRRRIYMVFSEIKAEGCWSLLERELGIDLPSGFNGIIWSRFFEDAELRDILDSVTLIWRFLKRDTPRSADIWLTAVARIFREEQVRYRVDAHGGVHFAVDEEFERNRVSALSVLAAGRYGGVRAAVDGAFEALDRSEPDCKEALRDIFEAIEILFKLMFPAQRLGGQEIRQHLNPVLHARFSADSAAKMAAEKLASSLTNWVDGVHFYRHGQAVESAMQPPLTITVALLSTGMGFLRWLAELDQASNRPSD